MVFSALPKKAGFTLIELLIVIAIILILISIALPNFLEAQMRAKVVRESSDMRSLATAIESLRTERNALLVDFWDDDNTTITQARFRGSSQYPSPAFSACCRWHRGDFRGGTTGLFTPLTTPVRYMTSVPPDPFFMEGDKALISQDVLKPVSYMYIDREASDMKMSKTDFLGAFGCWRPDGSDCPPGTRMVAPLRQDAYVLIGYGPDALRETPYHTPYSPTNGTSSYGDVLYRSDQQFTPR